MRALAQKQQPAHKADSADHTRPGLQISAPAAAVTGRERHTCPCGGGCPSCLNAFPIQKKSLEISSPTDADEKEADEVARKVVDGQPAEIRETGAAVNRSGEGPAEAAPEFRSALENSRGGGRALDDPTRSEMETKMGADLSGVRIHTGGAAHKMNEDVSAKAFTHGQDIFFRQGEFNPASRPGKELLAHELAHTVQQGKTLKRKIQRKSKELTEREKIDAALKSKSASDVKKIKDINQATEDEKVQLIAILLDQFWVGPYDEWKLEALWTSFGDQLLPILIKNKTLWENSISRGAELAKVLPALKARMTKLKEEADAKPKTGEFIGEVASSSAKLKDMTHDMSVLETGTGTYEGNRYGIDRETGARVAPLTPKVKHSDCTEFVLEVLEETFTKQGQEAAWAKIKKRYGKLKGKSAISGLDVQIALQETGWKGIYWAPDPSYLIPKKELSGKGIKSEEAGYNLAMIKQGKRYYQNAPGRSKGYPGVRVDEIVTDYAPEVPNEAYRATHADYPGASTTKKNTTQLEKLKKLPFGVFSAHGGYHMLLINFGKVMEVHWDVCATREEVIQQTDLEKWAIGPGSGYHFFASGVIVAPAKDVDAAFK